MRARICNDSTAVEMEWPDGTSARFHAIWLRDNSLDPATRSPVHGQRLITVTNLAADMQIERVRILEDGLAVRFTGDETEARFAPDWLRAHIYDHAMPRPQGWLDQHLVTWDHSLQQNRPQGHYDAVVADRDALLAWLLSIQRYGFALLTGGPVRQGAVLEVAALFGYVRETNYGRLFDVRTEVDPTNLAYTAHGLPPHTDNPYRDPPPTLQILYCLQNSAAGGRSQVVDGFRACHLLRDENPAHFDLLSRYCARFEYAGAPGVCLRARHPIIELAPDGELTAVRINNRSIAPLVDIPFDDMPAYYEALRHFEAILARADMAVSFRLQPGECFLVDNTRVLHAREGFDAAGSRWLQGCYADRDGLLCVLAAA